MQAAAAARAGHGTLWAVKPQDWADRLRNGDPRDRYTATKALGMYGVKAATQVEALHEALEDDLPEVRAEAAAAIGCLGKVAWPLASDLGVMVREDDEPEVRAGAARALGVLGVMEASQLRTPPAGAKGKGAAGRSASKARSASKGRPSSAGAGTKSATLLHSKVLMDGILDDNVLVRTASSVAIGRIHRTTRPPRPQSAGALSRINREASMEALGLRGKLGEDDGLYARLLGSRLGDPDADPKARAWMAKAIGVIGKPAQREGLILEHLLSEVESHREEEVFEGRVRQGAGQCVVSYPGAYLAEWESFARWSDGALSSACVFLPRSDPQGRYGQHVDNPDTPGQCHCHSLYGRRKPWGCQWFHLWQDNVRTAVRLGLKLVVVFRPAQVDKGVVEWDDLPKEGTKLWNKVGLGGSQKGEVAWLKKNGHAFVSTDVPGLQQTLEIKEHKCLKTLREKGRGKSAGVQKAAAEALSQLGLKGLGKKEATGKKLARKGKAGAGGGKAKPAKKK